MPLDTEGNYVTDGMLILAPNPIGHANVGDILNATLPEVQGIEWAVSIADPGRLAPCLQPLLLVHCEPSRAAAAAGL